MAAAPGFVQTPALIDAARPADTCLMGLNLNMGSILIGVFISMIGSAVVLYGRKEVRVPHIAAGVILIIFPYFVSIWWLAILIAAIILASLSLASRLGY